MGQVDHIYLAKQTDIYGSRPASMFEARQTNTMRRSLFSMLEVTYHASVQKVRSSHHNAVWAIMISILQAGMFVGGFYLMFYFIGAREAKLRGDFMMYLLSGIYLYLCHIRAVAAVSAAKGGHLIPDATWAHESNCGDCILADLGILRANHLALGDFIRAAHVQRHGDLPQLESRFDDLPFDVVFWLWRGACVSRDAPMVPRSDPICATGLYADQYGRVRQDVCRQYGAGIHHFDV